MSNCQGKLLYMGELDNKLLETLESILDKEQQLFTPHILKEKILEREREREREIITSGHSKEIRIQKKMK